MTGHDRRRGAARAATAMFIGALAASCASPAPGPAPSASPLSVESYLEGRWPSRPTWSPDGRHLSFLWTDWRGQELYVVPATGGAPVQLTKLGGFVGGSTWNSAGSFGAWSPDGRRIVYAHEGDLYAVDVPGATITRLTTTAEGESGATFSPDGTRLAFARSGNVFVMVVAGGATRQVTTDGRASGPAWSPDGRWLAFGVGDAPEWLTATPAYSGPLITYRRPRAVQRDVALVAVDGGPVRVLAGSPEQERLVEWAPDGSHLLVERTTIDVKTRTLFSCAVATASCQSIFEHRDDKYLASNDQTAAYSPDGRWLMITSDHSGWTHVYRMPVGGGEPQQVTSGAFEVSFASWSRDSSRIFFSSTEAGTPERHLYVVAATGGARQRLTTTAGVDTTLAVAPVTDQLAYIHSEPTKIPDLWTLETSAGATPRQLTESMTPALKAYPWQTPEIVTFPGQGGLPITAQLFVPRARRDGVRYPAIVHVHQAAIYQEAYRGPGPQKDNTLWYGWHQRLADLGYVVLNVDFRGSYGYGRAFRTANHLDIGVGDAADVIEGVEYLKRQAYVNPARLGVLRHELRRPHGAHAAVEVSRCLQGRRQHRRRLRLRAGAGPVGHTQRLDVRTAGHAPGQPEGVLQRVGRQLHRPDDGARDDAAGHQ